MSSSDNNNGGPGLVIGAVLLMGFFVSLIFKMLKNFFIELGQTFNAFGNMTGSFISMLWNVLQVVSLLSLIVASLVCAIYFTIRYLEMVKDGTALREWVQKSVAEFQTQINAQLKQHTQNIESHINNLDERLTEALTEPEIAPPLEATAVNGSTDVVNAESFTPSSDSLPDNLNKADGHASDPIETVLMSNPL